MVKTRFAPSPTGKAHVGNISTAIYNYLYAKANRGEFIVRIEDTDRERFVPEAVEYIEESLKWLELTPDNGEKIHQSDRLDIYHRNIEKLLEKGDAYKCFCTKERLDKLREKQKKEKKPPAYDNYCRDLSKEKVEKQENEGKKYVVRFKIPDSPKEITWDDLIRGKISIRTDLQDDFIIQKSDRYPTYNFANVVDDHDMNITHVIRAEEFIPSTPKHLLIYKSLGFKEPVFAHMPHIIGEGRSKLSKRHGATAILDYREQGYLPESMLNFLTLLGWNDGTTKELFTKVELEKEFDIERVGKSPAVFDIEKLNWINGEKIRAMSIKELLIKIEEFDSDFLKRKDKALLKRALTVMQTRMVTLTNFTKNTEYFFEKPKYEPKLLIFGKSTEEKTLRGLKETLATLKRVKSIDNAQGADNVLKAAVEKENLSNGDIFWPVRVALSGKEKSASPGELLWALGKDESIKRIEKAIKLMEK